MADDSPYVSLEDEPAGAANSPYVAFEDEPQRPITPPFKDFKKDSEYQAWVDRNKLKGSDIFQPDPKDANRFTSVDPYGNGVAYDLRGMWAKYAKTNPITGWKDLQPTPNMWDEFATPDAPQGFTPASIYAKGKDPNTMGFWDKEDGKEVWRDKDYRPATTTDKILGKASQVASNAYDSVARGATDPQTWLDLVNPVKGAENAADTGGELLKGLGGSFNKVGTVGAMAGAGAAVIADKVHSIFTGKDSTTAQDWMFDNAVKPMIDRQQAFEVAKDAGLPDKIANGVGGVIGVLDQAILTGPEVAVEGLLAKAGVGAASMSLPAVTQASDIGRQVYEKTGDRAASLKAATAAYLTTAASGAIPAAIPGKLATRVASGAVIGAGQAEGNRQLMNAALPDSMQTEYSPEQSVEGAVMGAGFGALHGVGGQPRPAAAGAAGGGDAGERFEVPPGPKSPGGLPGPPPDYTQPANVYADYESALNETRKQKDTTPAEAQVDKFRAAAERAQADGNQDLADHLHDMADRLAKVTGLNSRDVTPESPDTAGQRRTRPALPAPTATEKAQTVAEAAHDPADIKSDTIPDREEAAAASSLVDVSSDENRVDAAALAAPETLPAEPETAPDRRVDLERRQRVDQMSPDEMRRELLTHELTGIPNRRAYEESEKLPVQASIDADSLKWVNDTGGHEAGDQVLQAIATALHDATPGNAFHISGDEFTVQGEDHATVDKAIADARARLADAKVEFTGPDGQKITLNGIGFSHGKGSSLAEADANLQAEKRQREQTGLRAARGEQPPGASRAAIEAGLPADESEPAAEEKPVGTQDVTPPPAVKGQTHLGTNAKGEHVYEDEKGVRSALDPKTGVRVTESVELRPTRGPNGGIKYEPVRSNPEDPRFEVAQPAVEGAADQAQTVTHGDEHLPAERVPEVGARADENNVAAGDRNREPLDEGLAGHGEGASENGPVSEILEGAGGTGTERVEPTGEWASGEPRDNGTVRPESETADAGDHRLDNEELGKGGLRSKYRDNVAAIRILKALDTEGRVATPEERSELARYVGWGAMKGVFDPANKQWAKQHEELKSLLTADEWRAARASTLNAHYTSKPVVKGIFDAIQHLGFDHGRVLEPSVGTGNFFGLMPADMRGASELHGVELDPLTAKIAKALYPSANIKQMGFQDFDIPAEYFDAVIGNPPFGNEPIVDSARSPYSGASIHNYFLSKAIDKLRPGGIMAVVVSHNFLDARNAKTREWIAQHADLIGAARLPQTAFKNTAGTEVVTDVVVLQKRAPGTKGNADQWVDAVTQKNRDPKTDLQHEHSVNKWMANRPENVLGEPSAAGAMYQPGEYTVMPTGDLDKQLDQWVKQLPQGVYTGIERGPLEADQPDVAIPEGVKVGSYFVDSSGAVRTRTPDALGRQTSIPWQHPNLKALDRVKRMIGLRDLLREQMRMERSDKSTPKNIEKNRKKLNAAYDQFQSKYGLLNTPVNRRLFLDDTEAPLVLALEFDYDRGVGEAAAERESIEARPPSARKADIFKQRVLFPPADNIKVSTAKDALLASLNFKGMVDPQYMSQVYDKSPEAIEHELGDVVFRDPQKGLVTADEYLSGDVKTKLAEAKAAALEKNVAALEKVIPQDKLPSQIHATLGAAFVPEDVYGEFYRHITGAPHEVRYVPALGQWFTKEKGQFDAGRNGDLFGTKDISAQGILHKTMAGQAVLITKTLTHSDGSTETIVMQNETELARAKQEAIKDEWKKWLWSDADRADRVAGIYNEKLNRIVNRKFDGLHLTFPGMSPAISLLDHQKNAVWRGLQSRQMLLDHVVGAGKTYAMATLAMEMRRLGISRKPMLAVPNHLTGQWRSEFSKLYPSSYILVAEPEDFQKANRQKFFSKIATGDWDAVIVGHSSLKKIGLPPETEKKIITEQMDRLSEAIEMMKRERGDRNIIRDMENIKAKLEAKFKTKINNLGERDKVVSFDELGLDSLMVDELHEFKNLFYTSTMARAAGMGNPTGSDKAFDLFVKSRWLTDTFGDKAPIIGATGTPVSNSLVEMYNMQRYLQYPTLQKMGLDVFDSWAKQFGNMESVYEVAPSGTGWRNSTRFQKFANLPALMSLYKTFADTVTLDNLKAQETAQGRTFPVPKLKTGGPINVVAPRSKLQENFMGTPRMQMAADGLPDFGLSVRPGDPNRIKSLRFIKDEKTGKYEARGMREDDWEHTLGTGYETQEDAEMATVQKALTPSLAVNPESILGKFENLRRLMKESKGKINALSLTGAANKAGLDYRLIDPSAPDHPGSKINRAVENIVENYKRWDKDKGTQLVFCDLSVPLSARASSAAAPRLVYVRDPSTQLLTHKRGTMHTVVGHEQIPYFAVERGTKEDKRVDVYDAASGRLVNQNLKTKAEAHQWAKTTLDDENARTRWHLARNEVGEIDQDSIDDYNNTHEIDPEETPVFGRDDIAGASGPAKFSVYDDIKAKLIKAGIPAREVAFIHDYNTPSAKQKLFDQVNAGDVRVLLGSTAKMGAGTNVQKRIVGLHHIDAPWRPSDLEQRDGRAIRRGNLLYDRDSDGFRMRIYRYATAQTYDTRRWQVLEHKARGIEQLRNYDSSIEEIDDIEGQAADAADMKAAASGDPLILEETKLRNEVQALERLSAATADQQAAMRQKARQARQYATVTLPDEIATLKAEGKIATANPANKDGWAPLEVAGKEFHGLDKFEPYLTDIVNSMRSKDLTVPVRVEYRGLAFQLQPGSLWDGTVVINIKAPSGERVSYYTAKDTVSPSGFLTRLSNYVANIPERIDFNKRQIEQNLKTAADSEEASKRGFDKQAELDDARNRFKKVRSALLAKGPTVPDEERPMFEQGTIAQREGLENLGLGERLHEFERGQKREMLTQGTGGTAIGTAKADDSAVSEPTDAYGGKDLGVDSHGEPVKAQFKTRPDTTAADVRRGLSDLVMLRDRRAGAAVLGNAIPAAFASKGTVSLIGQRVGNIHDLALLQQANRRPDFEVLHLIFTKGDQVVHHTAMSSRLPGAAKFQLGEPGKDQPIDYVRSVMQAQGADGYWISHNHPSGKSQPSLGPQSDEQFTYALHLNVPGFKGHVVIDSHEYSTMTVNPRNPRQIDIATHSIDGQAWNVGESAPRVPHKLLGARLDSPQALARIQWEIGPERNGVHVFAVSSNPKTANVRALTWFPKELVNYRDAKTKAEKLRIVARLRRVGIGSGGSWLFAIGENAEILKTLPPIFQDVMVSGDSGSFVQNDKLGGRVPNLGRRIAPAYQVREIEKQPTFYSAVSRAVDAAKREKGTGAEWEATLRNMPGVKPEEMQWLGLKDWLQDRGRVTKQEVADYVRAHQIQVGEKLYGMGQLSAADHMVKVWEWMEENADPDEVDNSDDGIERRQKLLADAAQGDPKAIGTLESQGVPEALLAPFYDTRQGNGDKVDEAPRYVDYAAPGGKHYREMLLTMPNSGELPLGYSVFRKGDYWHVELPSGETIGAWHTRDAAVRSQGGNTDAAYRSGHWDEPNVLVHARFDERQLPTGERTLHIAEIQSDWHHAGWQYGYRTEQELAAAREKQQEFTAKRESLRQAVLDAAVEHGMSARDASAMLLNDYIDSGTPIGHGSVDWQRRRSQVPEPVRAAMLAYHATNDEVARMARSDLGPKVPDAPFKTTWQELALKRLLRHAVDKGFDALSWDTGQTVSDRFSLTRQIESVHLSRSNFRAYGHDDQLVHSETGVTLERLEQLIGKDAATKLWNMEPEPGTTLKVLDGLDLDVGSEGKKAIYDKMLPTKMAKIVKPFGGKVERGNVGGSPSSPISLADFVGRDPELSSPELQSQFREVHALMGEHGTSYENAIDIAGSPELDHIIRQHYSLQQEATVESDRNGYVVMYNGQRVGAIYSYKPDAEAAAAKLRTKLPAHIVRITPQMREGVSQGLPLFEPHATYGNSDSVHAPEGTYASGVLTDDRTFLGRPGFAGKGYDLARRAAMFPFTNKLAMDVRKILNPRSLSEESKLTAQRVVPFLADLARQKEMTLERLEPYSRDVDRFTHQQQLHAYHEAETGQPYTHPELSAIMDAVKKMLRETAEQVQAMGPGHLDHFIDNFLPHYYTDEAKAKKFFAGPFGRRPLKGPATFKKQRYYATMRDAMEKGGLKPLSANPLIQGFLKIYEMHRYMNGVAMARALKDDGYAEFFPMSKRIPEGWKEIDDPAFRVSQWSEAERGFVQRGRYAMPEDGARLLNNHLGVNHLANFSPAMTLRALANSMTMFQLGFSGFHLGFTSTDALISKNALAYERLMNGEFGKAAAAFAEAYSGPVGVLMNISRGRMLKKAYLDPRGSTPELQILANALVSGGGRVRMGTEYDTARGMSPFHGVGAKHLIADMKKVMRDPDHTVFDYTKTLGSVGLEYATKYWRTLKEIGRVNGVWGAPFNLLGRTVRASTAFMLDKIVPWQKLGGFFDLGRDYLERNPDATPAEVNEEMQKAWHSIDNRLGEVVYDNNFWNRSFKMAMHLSLRAVGWRFGTLQELGGGAHDFLKAADTLLRTGRLSPKDFTHKMAYLMALLTAQAVSGALLQYLLTGESPRDLKDLMFPRTGYKKKDGSDERLSIPTYMKDMYGYMTQPGHEVASMLNPILGELYYQIQGTDYWGDPLYDPNDSGWEQFLDRAHHFVSAYTPFVVENNQQSAMANEPGVAGALARVGNFFGLKTAPKAITNPEGMAETEHYLLQKKWEKKLRYDLQKAHQQGDQAEVDRLQARLSELKAQDRKEHAEYMARKHGAQTQNAAPTNAAPTGDEKARIREEARRRRGETSQVLDHVNNLVDQGGGKEAIAKRVHAAGYPALAGLIRAVPDTLRPQVRAKLAEYA